MKLQNKEEYKFMIDRLEHSILIINDHQIEFVNTKFLNQFKDLIVFYHIHGSRKNENYDPIEDISGSSSRDRIFKLCSKLKNIYTY